ncbi:hypothetical protein [Phycicoccus jejuensis]|uniref:hypothetical protein n=1 Tax=Phycicoccus jejuensis TaxID=367299 RepID=UPI000A9B91E8|nr:hypothetical protein [Phycicoccus jejuensis]
MSVPWPPRRVLALAAALVVAVTALAALVVAVLCAASFGLGVLSAGPAASRPSSRCSRPSAPGCRWGGPVAS